MKRTVVIIFLLIIAVMLGSKALFHYSNTDMPNFKASKQQIAQSESKVKLIDKQYEQTMLLFKKRNDSLQRELKQTQLKLQAVKVRLNQSEINVLHFANKDTAHESIAQQLSDCDSLKTKVIAFAGIMDSTQNIYECNIMQLQNKVAIRDSELVLCQSSYTEMKNLMDENLERERQLTEDLQTAYKQQKRKAIQSKLLAGGFLLLSGITTTFYLNSKQ